MVELFCQEKESSERESVTAVPTSLDTDYTDNENQDTGVLWHKEHNLANWLQLPRLWTGLRLEAMRFFI